MAVRRNVGTSVRQQAQVDAFADALDGQNASADPQLLAISARLQALPRPTPPTLTGAGRTAVLGAAGLIAAEIARGGAVHVAAAAAGGSAGTAAGSAVGSAAGVAGTTAAGATGAAVGAIGGAVGGAHVFAPIVAGVLATAIGLTGVGVAAHRSTPGQPFYAVKKATESIQLDLAGSSADRARTRLDFAQARLDELRKLAGPDASTTTRKRIGGLLDDIQDEVNAAIPALLYGTTSDKLALWKSLTSIHTALDQLQIQLPGTVQAVLTQTTTLLAETQQSVAGILQVPLGTSSGPGSGSGSGDQPVAAATTAPAAPRGAAGQPGKPTTRPRPTTPVPPGRSTGVAPARPSAGPTVPALLPPVLPSVLPSDLVPSVLAPITGGLGDLLSSVGGLLPHQATSGGR
jgi:hypothetical protein